MKGSDDTEMSEADKTVIQQLEKLNKQVAAGKSVSANLLKIAKDLFTEKNRAIKAEKEA